MNTAHQPQSLDESLKSIGLDPTEQMHLSLGESGDDGIQSTPQRIEEKTRTVIDWKTGGRKKVKVLTGSAATKRRRANKLYLRKNAAKIAVKRLRRAMSSTGKKIERRKSSAMGKALAKRIHKVGEGVTESALGNKLAALMESTGSTVTAWEGSSDYALAASLVAESAEIIKGFFEVAERTGDSAAMDKLIESADTIATQITSGLTSKEVAEAQITKLTKSLQTALAVYESDAFVKEVTDKLPLG